MFEIDDVSQMGWMMSERIKNILKSVLPPSTKMLDRRMDAILRENEVLRQSVSLLSDELSKTREDVERTKSGIAALRADGLMEEMAQRASASLSGSPRLIVSVASYGPRISSIVPMIDSVRAQTMCPERFFLWLPSRDFPHGVRSLPPEVICALRDADVEPRFVERDLGPHNKYYWTMQAFPESTVITLDDDIRYPSDLIERLVDAHEQWPTAVVGMRTHIISFLNDTRRLAPYDQWSREQRVILDHPSHQLISTGVGGVLYPAHCLSPHVFDIEGIQKTCLRADDLWLKVMEVANGTKTVCPSTGYDLDYVDGTQEVALYKRNLCQGENDAQLNDILEYVASFFSVKDILTQMAEEASCNDAFA